MLPGKRMVALVELLPRERPFGGVRAFLSDGLGFEEEPKSFLTLMLIAGLMVAVLIEWMGVHILGRWQYTNKMPTVAWLRVGLAPIAQMLFLPPLIFRIVSSLRQARK